MRIDNEYMSELVTKMLEAPAPTFTLWELEDIRAFITLESEEAGVNRDKFIFHMEILFDDGFIDTAYLDDKYVGMGIARLKDGSYSYSKTALRLTAAGHRYATMFSGRDRERG